MLCKSPFIRSPQGIKKADRKNVLIRQDSTPFGCGQCICCRINKAREWKLRILLEKTAHEQSCFVTLTYADEFLPPFSSLEPYHFTKFLKDLRYHLNRKFRYFGVGEYGREGRRGCNPHYHLAMFGVGEEDADMVDKIWKKGRTDCTELNQNTAAYVAGYVTEKMGTKDDELLTEEQIPKFTRSSKQNGGIGFPGIKKIAEDIKKHGIEPHIQREMMMDGKSYALGRYLTRKMAEHIGVHPREFLMDYFRYQETIFDRYMDQGKPFIKAFQDAHQQRRLTKEKRHRMRGGK